MYVYYYSSDGLGSLACSKSEYEIIHLTGRQPIATKTEKRQTYVYIQPRVGSEPTIPLFERAKTFHALDR
jgi:hypothetical protein